MIPVFRFAPWQPPVPGTELSQPTSQVAFTPAVLLSTSIVVALLLFVWAGPWVWPYDPAQQWLSHISQGPTPAMSALVVDDTRPPRLSTAPQRLQIAESTTERVALQWPQVSGVQRYRLYRAGAEQIGPGLPLWEGSDRHYIDRLQLSYRVYRYTLADADTGLLLFSLETRPEFAISAFEAALQGLIPEDARGLPERVLLPAHPLGTDALGRDLLARMMAGGRSSLFVGIVAPLLYIGFGCVFGGLAGYLGGRLDQFAMRLADFVVALPFLLFMILLRIAFGIGPGENGILPLILAMLLLSWPGSARLVRGQVLALRSQAFIDSARLSGRSAPFILYRHILPNVLPVILVAFSFAIPSAIFTEAFLSFIGMGVSPPSTSWGAMCNDGIKTLLSNPRQLLLPAMMISIAVLAFNTLGDALRDATDRRSGGGRL
ncbi:ABC transporter permease subunit [Spongiibacter tropicus]|uniref:ABC transporter permease subunit n=1 Tax=Spongiibacter tropicus TaxID=454602 RepID=UPI0035BE87EF